MGVKEAMLRSIKLTSRNTSVCKDLTPEFYRKQAAFPCNVTDMMSHDVLTLTRQQANPRRDSSLENLSQKLQLHVFQSPKLACLCSCMRQLHSNQLHGKRIGGRAKLLNNTRDFRNRYRDAYDEWPIADELPWQFIDGNAFSS